MKALISLLCLLLPIFVFAQRVPLTTTELGMEVQGPSRTLLYSNHAGSIFCAESSAGLNEPALGWSVGGRLILKDYTIRIGDEDLSRSQVVQTLVYPHQFVRKYRNGVVETVTLLDHSNTIAVILDSLHGKTLNVRPWFSPVHDSSDLLMLIRYGEMIVGQEEHPKATPTDGTPGWLGILLTPGTSFSFVFKEPETGPLGYSPGSLGSGSKSDQFGILFVATPKVEDIYNLGAQNLRTFLDSLYYRRVRLDQVMNRSYLRTGDELIDRSIHWARLSLDALLVDSPVPFLRSGLPTAGRIDVRSILRSLSGALLTGGEYETAKEIFRFLAAREDTDSASRTFGRIPSAVDGGYLRYDAADVTPLFVSELDRMVQQSGDTLFARELFPAVARSVDAALASHVDSLTFLVHGESETWMPVSRGTRAVELEAFWYRQLESGADLARLANEPERAERWTSAAQKVRANFNSRFVNPSWSALADALEPSGQRLDEIRPNQIFARELVNDRQSYANVFSYITKSLVYRQGVGTLSSADPDFTPVHFPARSVQQPAGAVDGPIAQWLAGEWVIQAAQMGEADTAFQVTSSLARTIVDGDVPGTLPEILDVLPGATGKPPQHTGKLSSADALAEYMRSWYDGYLGVHIDRLGSRLTLRPALPSSIKNTDATVYVGAFPAGVRYHFSNDTAEVTITPDSVARPFTVEFILPGKTGPALKGGKDSLRVVTTEIHPGAATTLWVTKDVATRMEQGKRQNLVMGHLPPEPVLDGFRLADIPASLSAAARQSEIPLLTIGDVGKTPGKGAKTVYDAADSAGDDIGPGHEGYPPGPGYPAGSLDLTHCTVLADSSNVYFHLVFQNLPYPFLHPSAGFDGVMAAVAIEKRAKGEARTRIGRNAGFTVPQFDAAIVVYVGNGIMVEDGGGKVLAEYFPLPQDASTPIGKYQSRAIDFCLPQSVTGRPDTKWRFAVAVGPRDDAGGGIGVFRPAVSSHGHPASAVYDTLLPDRRR